MGHVVNSQGKILPGATVGCVTGFASRNLQVSKGRTDRSLTAWVREGEEKSLLNVIMSTLHRKPLVHEKGLPEPHLSGGKTCLNLLSA